MNLLADGGFRPDLAVGVLTLVPLILITSALGVGILGRWSDRLDAYRSNKEPTAPKLVRAVWPAFWDWYLPKWREKHARWFSLVFGCGMGLASIAAIVMALVELTWQTNGPDDAIFGCSLAVTLGVGVAIIGNITRALRHGNFPTSDVISR